MVIKLLTAYSNEVFIYPFKLGNPPRIEVRLEYAEEDISVIAVDAVRRLNPTA